MVLAGVAVDDEAAARRGCAEAEHVVRPRADEALDVAERLAAEGANALLGRERRIEVDRHIGREVDDVVAGAAVDDIVATVGPDLVVAGAGLDQAVAIVIGDAVGERPCDHVLDAAQHVVAERAGGAVRAQVDGHRPARCREVEGVDAAVAAQLVVACAAAQHVVAAAAEQQAVAGRSVHRVVAVRALVDVVPGRRQQDARLDGLAAEGGLAPVRVRKAAAHVAAGAFRFAHDVAPVPFRLVAGLRLSCCVIASSTCCGFTGLVR